jgi:hypothetical protein
MTGVKGKSGSPLLKERTYNREQALKYFRKKCAEDPTWNARKQREYRQKNPTKAYFWLAKSCIKKLTDEQKKELVILCQ